MADGESKPSEGELLGNYVSDILEQRGMSVGELADRAGVSKSAIYDSIKGKVKTPQNTIKYSILNTLHPGNGLE